MLLLPLKLITAFAPRTRCALKATRQAPDRAFRCLLRELLLVGAHEWRKRRRNPRWANASIITGFILRYAANIGLVRRRRCLPPSWLSTSAGTGVLALPLAASPDVATDMDPRALSGAKENLLRLNLMAR